MCIYVQYIDIPSLKLTFPLNIDGWKIKFRLEMVYVYTYIYVAYIFLKYH